MKWQKERDLLIAQTTAFVQSVAGKTAAAEGRVEPIPLGEFSESERAVEAEQPIETIAITRPSPVRPGGLREEIRGRVAAFRAHQQLFHRDRDKYYNSVLAKVRASREPPSKAPDHQPAKR